MYYARIRWHNNNYTSIIHVIVQFLLYKLYRESTAFITLILTLYMLLYYRCVINLTELITHGYSIDSIAFQKIHLYNNMVSLLF